MDAGPFVLRWACHADTDVNIDYRESDLAISGVSRTRNSALGQSPLAFGPTHG